jgi:hypothetical protein
VIYSTPTATVLPEAVEWLGKLYTLYASLLGINNDSLDGGLTYYRITSDLYSQYSCLPRVDTIGQARQQRWEKQSTCAISPAHIQRRGKIHATRRSEAVKCQVSCLYREALVLSTVSAVGCTTDRRGKPTPCLRCGVRGSAGI